MKSEVMAAAVTGIDDNLITEAQQISRKSNKLRPLYSICAVAACLVLVFTFIFAVGNQSKAPELILNGSKITGEPVAVDIPITAYARELGNELTIPLSLDIKEPTKIKISKGKMNVCSRDNTDTLYHTGTQYTTDIPVNIDWTIDGSDITKSYTLTLNDGEVVYALSFDEGTSLWSICKR